MKCGTTSLDYYLKAHPQISMPDKEIDYFTLNFNKGLPWYESQFKELKEGTKTIFGETSVSYAKYPLYEGIPERIHLVTPQTKLIYVVRDPIDRIVSHYMHNVFAGTESVPIEKLFKETGYQNHYINFSLYYMQIERFLEYFAKDLILIISLDDLKDIDTRLKTLRGIFKFLDIEENVNSSSFFEIKYQTIKKGKKGKIADSISTLPFYNKFTKISPEFIRVFYTRLFTRKIETPRLQEEFRKRLIEIIQPDLEKLRNFTGKAFKSYSA